jgi:hypothetical protein
LTLSDHINRQSGETVGVLDEFRSSFGDDALDPSTRGGHRPLVWYELCACGHLDRYHAPSIGGTFEQEPSTERTFPDGRRMVSLHIAEGCRGAMVNRGQVTVRNDVDETPDLITRTETFLSTCPCQKFRPVAKVDKPNRFFNQRIPIDRSDPLRHPFQVGIRAFSTHLSKRRAALSDPTWAEREFDRRFEWTARRCAISKCKATDDVWAVYLNPEGLSELRCPAHR